MCPTEVRTRNDVYGVSIFFSFFTNYRIGSVKVGYDSIISISRGQLKASKENKNYNTRIRLLALHILTT